MRKNKARPALLLVLAAVAACFLPARAQGQGAGSEKWQFELFFSPTCHECQKIRNEFLPRLIGKYPGRIGVQYRDISEMANFKRLFDLSKQARGNSQEVKVPAVFYSGTLLIGSDVIKDGLENLLLHRQGAAQAGGAAGEGYTPLAHFKSFTPLAVTAAGLVDGINPCAFTVIVFFVSFLALQGFRKTRLLTVGCFFIIGVFITYLLIGIGLFSFFYKLGAYWWLRVVFNWCVGGISLVFAGAAVVDAVKFLKTGQTDGMLLSLPAPVKKKIHDVIGMHYRGAARQEETRTMWRLMITAFVTGFLVSLLEAVCTGQMYLPTIVFVMKSTTMKLWAFAYLALYNVMFIIPLGVILMLAVAGMTSGQFTRFMTRNFVAVKSLMAALFLFLGIFLIWKG